MKARNAVRIGICLISFCFLTIHCADPNLPRITIVSPEQNAVIQSSAVPYSLDDVELSVPVPGCGATTVPVDPDSFSATLTRLVDGEVLPPETDVTSSFDYILDSETGAYTYTGTVELADFGDYQIHFTIQNVTGEGANTLIFRLEPTVAEFPGAMLTTSVSSLKQQPANCLFPDLLVPIIYGIIKPKTFELNLPSGADILANTPYPLWIFLPNPLGDILVGLSLDPAKNDILIDGPDDHTIDLTGMAPLPGFDCMITASADGVFNDIDPNDPDGSLTIGIIDVQPSPWGEGCTLSPPTGACALLVGMDGDPM